MQSPVPGVPHAMLCFYPTAMGSFYYIYVFWINAAISNDVSSTENDTFLVLLGTSYYNMEPMNDRKCKKTRKAAGNK